MMLATAKMPVADEAMPGAATPEAAHATRTRPEIRRDAGQTSPSLQ
jgi:hypothetical protein